jgi:hypothetical protein
MQPRRFSKKFACCAQLAALVGTPLLLARSAAAVEDIPDPDLTATGHLVQTGPVNVLPEAVSARVNTGDRATATAWGGYDGAKRSPLLTATAEVRIAGRVVLVAGAGYTADMPSAPQFRPQIGLRAQFLDQAKHGIDGGASLMYRQDLFSNEEGFFQGVVALERRQGRVRLVGNVLYGQDGEGDDHDGEVRVAALYEARPGLLVGADTRYRHDLFSSDPNRFARNRPEYEAAAGPTISYTRGSWAVMAETGFSAVRTTTTQTGVIALGGVASSF